LEGLSYAHVQTCAKLLRKSLAVLPTTMLRGVSEAAVVACLARNAALCPDLQAYGNLVW